MKVLIQHCADINAKNITGYTPLHISVDSGLETATENLIKNGADINARENSGWTPLHFAAWNGNCPNFRFKIIMLFSTLFNRFHF